MTSNSGVMAEGEGGSGAMGESLLPPDLKNTLSTRTTLRKFRLDGAVARRVFWLSQDESRLHWRRDRRFFSPEKTLELAKVNLVKQDFFPGNATTTEKVPHTVALFTAGGGASVTIGFQEQVEATKWFNALQMLTVDRKPSTDPKKAFYRKAWMEADKDGSNTLDFNEVLKLLDILDIKMDKRVVKKVFGAMDKDGSGELDFDEFTALLDHLKARKEVEQLIPLIAQDPSATGIPASKFSDFLRREQGEDVSEEQAQALIDKYEPKPPAMPGAPKLMGGVGLSDYFDSPHNSVFDPAHTKVYQDMTRTLTDYWCSSSHNTYLEGHQLRGFSSAAMYIKTLTAGCRCVELDCWDGPDAPIIYHGHTLTTKISFEDAIQAINDSAFVNTPYPVSLSIEMHCSVPQQIQMVEIMKRIFGDKLAKPLPVDTLYMPSPEDLKYKILVKGKKLKPAVGGGAPIEEESESDDDDEDIDDGVTASAKKTRRQSAADEKAADKAALKALKDSKKKEKPSKLSQEFSDIVYLSAVHFKNFQTSIEKGKGYEMSSFAEAKSVKLATTQKAAFIEYNKKQLSRIYPAGTRIDSSNYSPHATWAAGCQIVALNWQTYDEALWANQAKFRDNGGCGYLLKPDHLTLPGDAEPALVAANAVKHTLIVTILSGQHLPKPDRNDFIKDIIDPFVVLDLISASSTTTYKTRTIDDNGFNPVWGEVFTYNFSGHLKETHLRLTLNESGSTGDDFIAQYSIFLSDMRMGYRMVPLYSNQGFEFPYAHLFCHFRLT